LVGAGLGDYFTNAILYLFLQPLEVATSNLVHNVGLGVRYNNSFSTKLGRDLLVYTITSKIV